MQNCVTAKYAYCIIQKVGKKELKTEAKFASVAQVDFHKWFD